MAEDTSESKSTTSTKRLDFKKQSLDDAYAAPANLLEIEVCNPDTHGFGRNRYTDYEVRMRVSHLVVDWLYNTVRVLQQSCVI